MKALTLAGKQTVVYQELSDPKLADSGDVIVKVNQCAICGSDLHIYHDREKGCDHGTAMGHEFVGEIVEKGSEVTAFNVGTLVISPFTTSCGRCYFCKIGLSSRCTSGQLYGWKHDGTGLEGGQAEYVRVPLADSTLVKVLDGMSEDRALLMGDVFPTGYFCASQAEIVPGGTYVVLGCGPVGLMAVLAARKLGAENLFAVDSIPQRLKRATEFGAIAINLSDDNPEEVITEFSSGIGADGVLEVVGSPQAARLAYDLVRSGGVISSVGVHTASQFAFSPVEAYDKNIIFKSGRCPVRSIVEPLQQMVLEEDLPIDSIITHRMGLESGVHGYEIFDKKKDGCLKVVLKP